MFNYYKSIKKRDPALKNILQMILFYPGVHAIFFYRIASIFYKIKLAFIAYLITFLVRIIYNIEIHPGAKIGKNFFIDHGSSVVIGETAVIGDNCTIYHGVTLGSTGKKTVKRHPTLLNNVIVGAHAQVLGDITIGNNVKIGANATVVESVSDNKTVIGYKAVIKG